MAETVRELVFPNPDLVGVPSRLYSPGYVGPARWVLFEPHSRRAFSALGKDVIPDAISVLAAASGGASRAQLAAWHEHVTPTHIDSLIEAGLLMTEQRPQPDSTGRSFISSFHTANVDYPFFDYGSPSVAEQESKLLDHYAALWPAPPPILPREGQRYPLPAVDVTQVVDPGEAELTLQTLAWILKVALAPIGEIPTRYVTCVRRTTPSGGARHPTEVIVLLSHSLGAVPAGTYTYDIASHALVDDAADAHQAYVPALAGGAFGLMIRTRVERPMWRYRDLRALRPVFIDAGHVVELVTLLLGRLGIAAEVVSPPVAPARDAWLDEPEVVLIRPAGPVDVVRESESSSREAHTTGAMDRQEYLTNPVMVLRFDRTMYASVIWPSRLDVEIDLTDFLILNHCLPSWRGDRDSSATGVLDAVPDASPAAIDRLRDNGALLPAQRAERLYTGGRQWVRHEWYLSLLAYLEALSSGVDSPATSRLDPDHAYISDLKTIFRRRTSRVFSSKAVSETAIEELLRRVFPVGRHPAMGVSLAVWNVHGLEGGLYRWRDDELNRIGNAPTRESVAANTAGQTAASSGAVAIWVSLLTDTARPESYVMDLIDLGRVGQRICLAATDLGLAVFLTPAVHDRGTCSLIKIEGADRRLTYVFGLGDRDQSADST